MAQVNPILLDQLKADFTSLQSLGSPLLGCQGMLVPRDYPDIRFLIQSCPRPIVTNGDPAQVQYAGGLTGSVAGVPTTYYEGTLTMIETEAGHAQYFAELVVASGGQLDCDYYDGRLESFLRSFELLSCNIRFDQAEFNTDNRSQVMTVSCPFSYNYFGNFASIGTNGTTVTGQKSVTGSQSLIQRVQSVLATASAAASSVSSIANSVSRLSSLF